MQNFSILIFGAVLSIANARAEGFLDVQSIASNHANLVNRVAECSVVPYSVGVDGTKTQYALVSHCPEVKVETPGQAKIKVNGHIFQASLSESPDSDEDLYDVTITDLRTGESTTYPNVLAFGDVLLGILGGDPSHVQQKWISDSTSIAK